MLLQMARFHSCLWLNGIPLCVAVPVCMCIYHIFFTHLSMDTYVASISLLLSKKNAMNMEGYIYVFKLVFLFFSEKYPKVELLDHVIVLCVCVYMCLYLNIYVYICLNKCVLFFWTRSSFRLSLIAASGGHSVVVVCGLLTVVASLVPERGL